jgi:adenylate cyclase
MDPMAGSFLKRTSRYRLLASQVGIGIAAAVLVFLLYRTPILQRLEYVFWNYRFMIRGPIDLGTESVVIVAIDDQSYRELGKFEDWPRAYHAKVVEHLKSLGARVIAFDINFFEPSPKGPEDDRIFAEAVRKAGNVVLGIKKNVVQNPAGGTAVSVELPIKELREAALGLGFVNKLPDEDSFIRRELLLMKHREKVYASLGLKAFLEAVGAPAEKIRFDPDKGALDVAGYAIPCGRGGSPVLPINFAGPASTFKIISYEQLLDDEGTEALRKSGIIQDAIVLVGTVLLEHHDFYPTAFSFKGEDRTSGVEIHANVIRNLVAGDFLGVSSRAVDFLSIVLLCTAGALLVHRFKPVRSLPLCVLLGVLFAAGVIGLFLWRNMMLNLSGPLSGLFLTYMGTTVFQYLTESRKAKMIRGMFQHYVSPAVAEKLIGNPDLVRLGGHKQNLTVFFSDIAGFTTISEQLPPENLASYLSEYLTAMTGIIFKYDGFLDKYLGDAVMAVFGEPIPVEDHARRACITALEMQREQALLRNAWKERGGPEFHARTGINTGMMVVGNMGSRDRFDYTVIGDSVNLASRLEGTAKEYGVSVIIGPETYEKVSSDFVTRELDLIRVKGKLKPVRIFELIGIKGEALEPARLKALELFSMGLEAYREMSWDGALDCFEKAVALHAKDGPSQVYRQRVLQYKESPPPDDWDRVFVMKTK